MNLRCAGVDWASDKHVVVVDELGRRVVERTIGHDEAGLTALAELLVEHNVGRVGIERPGGVLVERLLDAGIAVIAMHPNQVAATRPRFSSRRGPSGHTPTGRSFSASSATPSRSSAPPPCSPRSATTVAATRPPTPSPPTPA